jgi:hypothetical protein
MWVQHGHKNGKSIATVIRKSWDRSSFRCKKWRLTLKGHHKCVANVPLAISNQTIYGSRLRRGQQRVE